MGSRQGLENCALQCDRQRYVPDVEGAPTRCLEGAGDGFLEEISDLCLKGRATFIGRGEVQKEMLNDRDKKENSTFRKLQTVIMWMK